MPASGWSSRFWPVRRGAPSAPQGSSLTIALVIAGVIGAYLVAGGALCVSFIAQLSNWPPPGAPCAFAGGRFVREWPWAAARVLAELGLAELGHEAR